MTLNRVSSAHSHKPLLQPANKQETVITYLIANLTLNMWHLWFPLCLPLSVVMHSPHLSGMSLRRLCRICSAVSCAQTSRLSLISGRCIILSARRAQTAFNYLISVQTIYFQYAPELLHIPFFHPCSYS